MLFLEGIARGDWFGAILRVREGVSECGFVLEERPFSGVAMNFHIELLGARVRDLAPALQQREVTLNPSSLALLNGAPVPREGGGLEALLFVRFPDGDPNKSFEVPPVPG